MIESVRSRAIGNATRIAPRLWMGAHPPHGQALRQAGFSTLILCAKELQEPPAFWPGIAVLGAPLDDSGMPMLPIEKVTALSAARCAAESLHADHRVLVTCAQGRNRSGLVAALALHMLYGMSGDDCRAWIKRQRDPMLPHGREALANTYFTQFLREQCGGSSAMAAH